MPHMGPPAPQAFTTIAGMKYRLVWWSELEFEMRCWLAEFAGATWLSSTWESTGPGGKAGKSHRLHGISERAGR